MKSSFIEVFDRDLLKLADEINAYRSEEKIWELQSGITNSAGTLCLHLIGNLNHFIGAVQGRNGYIRKRDEEFSLRNISRTQMLAELERTRVVVQEVISAMREEDFLQEFGVEKHGQKVSTGFMFLHLVSHFNYHLGQINYHRRLLERL